MDDVKKLFRLECKPGNGVYSSFNNDAETNKLLNKCRDLMFAAFDNNLSSDKHPGPYTDKRLLQNLDDAGITVSEIFFGFNSELEFRQWFYSDELLLKMSNIGVTLVCYIVTELYMGDKQTCAPLSDRHEKNVLWRITPEEYLKTGFPKIKEVGVVPPIDILCTVEAA